MKITTKEYQQEIATRRILNNQAEEALTSENSELYFKLKAKAGKIDEWVEAIPTVSISFIIGYRRYYRGVIKIGKTYFTQGVKMTKENGFRAIKEIEAITDKMQNEMISDRHCY